MVAAAAERGSNAVSTFCRSAGPPPPPPPLLPESIRINAVLYSPSHASIEASYKLLYHSKFVYNDAKKKDFLFLLGRKVRDSGASPADTQRTQHVYFQPSQLARILVFVLF